MRDWLTKNSVFFETVAAVLLAAMAIVVSFFQFHDARRASIEQAQLTRSQNAILESSRRSAYRSQLDAILASVDDFVKESAAQNKAELKLRRGRPPLPTPLQTRIMAYSRVVRPYRVLDSGEFEPTSDDRGLRLLSPERGELFIYLLLSGIDLHGDWKVYKPTFAYADLQGQLIGPEDLSGMDFSGSDLSYGDLVKANLFACNLRGATLRHANLEGADLRGAMLDGTDLTGVFLDKCLVSANWLSATQRLDDPPVLERSLWRIAVTEEPDEKGELRPTYRLVLANGVTREKDFPIVDARSKRDVPFSDTKP